MSKKKEEVKEIGMVNHPPRYQIREGYEVIDVIEEIVEWLELKDKEAYRYSQLLGYILRYKKKNGLEDLKKARFFLNRMIDNYKEG